MTLRSGRPLRRDATVFIRPHCRRYMAEHHSIGTTDQSRAIRNPGVPRPLQRRRRLASDIETCCCGTDLPPSVSVDAESIRMWQAILECPACGYVACALGCAPLGALAQATLGWNAHAAPVHGSGFTLPLRYH